MAEFDPFTHPTVDRRSVLEGIAGGAALSALPSGSASATAGTDCGSGSCHATSFHPGGPLFVEVGERLRNPIHVGKYGSFEIRDNLAPRVPNPSLTPANYTADQFEWTLVERPGGSSVELTFETSLAAEAPRYSDGRENVAEFVADVPGTYVVELDAPDGTHRQTIYAFPAGNGPRPRVSLDATFDETSGEFVVDSNAAQAPSSSASKADLEVVFLADDRDQLATTAIDSDGPTARIPRSALGGDTARVHAAAHDGGARSVMDTIELDPDGTVDTPNRPPDWAKDGVMYQIFPRSWAGQAGETTMQDLVDGVEYLDELGIDMVWLTPVVPAESVQKQLGGELLAEEYRDLFENSLSGGGPHGYDTLDYVGVAPDLAPDGQDPMEAYQAFVDACHESDIKVVFDLVLNHCGRSHPLFQQTITDQDRTPPRSPLQYPAVNKWDTDATAFDWFARVDEANLFEGEFVSAKPYATGFFGLRVMPNFNYDNLAIREHMLAVADFWSGEIGVDGFRCDIAWGVPNSLWREIREVVRANNSEFLLLDETVPNDPRMSENAFQMHFDTGGFTETTQRIGASKGSYEDILGTITGRVDQGMPDHTLLLNLTENHDEHRMLNQSVIDLADPDRGSITDEEWERAARVQRAAWASGVLLPGVPGIYYGQERQISRYGQGRHRGPGDDRGFKSDGSINTGSDVRPGGRQRAFMNWEEYPEAHLEFYKTVVDLYDRADALKPDADLVENPWYETNGDLLVFGRDASDLDDVTGPDRVLCVVNFGDLPAKITVRPGVGDVDLLRQQPVEDEAPGQSAKVLTVDDVLVLETPEFYSVGSTVERFELPTGTDYGPGTYEYPTGDAYTDGVFDVDEHSIHETDDSYQFRISVVGDLTNPWGLSEGMSHPHLQVYVRDPESNAGATAARAGVNATFEAPYQYRVVADGENGVRLEDTTGQVLARGPLQVNRATNEFVAEVPADTLDIDLRDAEVATLMLGYDGYQNGNVRPVEQTAGTHTFGGATADTAPNIIDVALPADVSNSELLAYDAQSRAVLSYGTVGFEEITTFDLETGTGYGPGTYEPPTGEDYDPAAWDIDSCTVLEQSQRVRVAFEMATAPTNPWNLRYGFSQQFLQVYLRSPEADAPTTTAGRGGTNIAFETPYHYRIVANGNGLAQVENADGEVVTYDVDAGTDGRTIYVDFPRDAVGWKQGSRDVRLAPTIMPFDGYAEYNIRAIESEADTHQIGGGSDQPIDPAVMDMVVPANRDRSTVLSGASAGTPPKLPLVTLPESLPITVGVDAKDQ
jgi:glycosidase/carbohydrate-binding DOMON domain-containing protein